MLAILAAVALLVDPTTTIKPKAQVESSDPISATCEVKLPNATEVATVPCYIVALRDAEVMGAGFALPGDNAILFVGVPKNGGVEVGAVVINGEAQEAQGACAATEGVVLCGVGEGANSLIVRASY